MNFINDDHRAFYEKHTANLYDDREREAFFYLLGISESTRRNVKDLYNFRERILKPDGLGKGWQTSSTRALSRLAFDLFHGGPVIPSGYEGHELEDALEDYSAARVFSRLNEWAPYALEAIRLRYGITEFSAR